MKSCLAKITAMDKTLLARYGFMAGAAAVLVVLGFAVGHLSGQSLEGTAQAAAGDAANETTNKIFAQGADTRRVIAALPMNYGWASHRGKHEVALDFTITNNNDRQVKDIELACAFYSKKLNQLGTRKGVIADAIEAKGSKTFARIPVPQMTDKAVRVTCEIIDAKA